MTGVKFTSQVSIGNIMQVVMLLIAMGAAFATLRENAVNIEGDLYDEIQRGAARDIRLRSLESSATRADERYNSIMTLLQRIDKSVERLGTGK